MKNMRKQIAITAVAAIFAVAISACGASYPPVPTPTPAPQPGTPASTDPLSKFNTVWVSTGQNGSFTTAQQRSLANMLGYNTAHYTNPLDSGCIYGYQADSLYIYGGARFSASDDFRNYFTNTTATLIEVYPAPKPIGTTINYKIRFAANIDEHTRNIILTDAYFDIEIDAAYDIIKVKYPTIVTDMILGSQSHCMFSDYDGPCRPIQAQLKDECGDVMLNAYVGGNKLLIPRITFHVNPNSYKTASCYFGGRLPDSSLKDNTYPATAAEGIDMYGDRGKIFNGSPAATFVEQ